jgi:hypothetical protein
MYEFCAHASMCILIQPPVYPSTHHPSEYISKFFPIYRSVSLYLTYPPIQLSINVPINLSICLSICLSIYLSIR